MSSISFPSQPGEDGQYYSPAFDTSASFQMNPLSSHPPRTPRASVATNSSNVYGTTIYESQQGSSGAPCEPEEPEELDEEDEKAKQATMRVRREEVWRDIVLTSNGRDKAFKLIQYSIRVYLLFHTSGDRLLRRSTRPPWEIEFVKRLESTASGFSFTRKMLLLFNWLEPLTTVMADQTSGFPSSKNKKVKTFSEALLQAPPLVLLTLVNAIADDISTLGLVGLLSKRTGEKAGNVANWCWLLCSLAGLVENGVERQLIINLQRDVESRLYNESMSGATAKSKPTISKIDERELARLQKQDYWLQVTRLKLIMDVIFVCYDIFKFKRGNKSVKALTGLASAILSAAKLYDKHKNTLVKTARANIH